MIQFKFNPRKTVQAAAMLLKLNEQPINYLKLLKLLYMADRIALQRIEQSISGDQYCSMDFGPVLSRVYDAIKGKRLKDDYDVLWARYISPRNQNYRQNKIYDV